MLTRQRKQYILDRLQQDGQVVAKVIAQDLGLSEDTIRRDLRELAKEGLLQRVHGGALPSSAAIADFDTRQGISLEGKQAIAKTAAQLIQPGQIVIFDGGTTTVQLARQLPKTLVATVVTHSPSIAIELANHPQIEVILIGGKLFKHSLVTVGTAALAALAPIQADLYFMGVTGVHPQMGLSTGDLEEAHMKKALSEHAGETIVLASHEKLGKASAYGILPMTEISTLIVEKSTPEKAIAIYRGLGITVQIAE